MALAHDAQAAWTGFATKHRHGRDDASRHELRQDAPTIETDTSIPSRRKRTASLRLPHIR